jgi:mannose-6-phosphate isomerase-like protein (cupin superfamily)
MARKLHGWCLYDRRGTFFNIESESEFTQTAVMTLKPGEDGGQEASGHPGDQVLYVAEGQVTVMTPHEEMRARAGTVITIPARTPHRVRNTGSTAALLLNVYSPPSY